MKSSIKFTSECSQKEVNFLDMTVRLEKDHLVTDLFMKQVDTHTYLHAKSFHPPSTISSLPKAQFIRIRRICSDINDFKRHANRFIDFFAQRGFKARNLQKIMNEIASVEREVLLQPRQNNHSSNESEGTRVVLSVKWHPRLKFLSRMIHSTYDLFSSEHPNLKAIFKESPIVAFRKNRTIRDRLVHARATSKPAPSPTNIDTRPRARFMLSTATTLTNVNSGVTVNTLNNDSSISDSHVIYAAECTKCNLIYIGQTTQKLFERFTGHRSDIAHHPERCDLPGHFHDAPNGCDFNKDLQIHILQKHLTGSRCVREAEEDKWMIKLGTLSPAGMNGKMSDYGCLYKALF